MNEEKNILNEEAITIEPPSNAETIYQSQTGLSYQMQPATPKTTAPSSQSQPRQTFWSRHKGTIAIALICSLLGGMVGSLATTALVGNRTAAVIPNGTAPINITAGEASPVVAIAAAVSPSIVGITNKALVQNYWFGYTSEQEMGSGSGVIFREDGYIITNYHVVEGASSLLVSLADGSTVDGQIVGVDETTDLAVIKIEADNLTAAVLGDSDSLQVGELAVAIGNPLGNEFARTVTDGIISGIDRTIQAEDRTYHVLQTNAAINSGNSGGALVNSKGEVIGINSVKVGANGVEGMGFAIPINEVKPIVAEIMEKGYVSRPYLGIVGSSLTKQLAEKYQLAVSNGVIVIETTEGGPAAKAGLKAGDIIYKIDDEILQSMDHLSEILENHKAGDVLHLLIDRNGQTLEAKIQLGDKGKSQQNNVRPQNYTYSYQLPR